jgi:hypothetical protein
LASTLIRRSRRHIPRILGRSEAVPFTSQEIAGRRAGDDLDRRLAAAIEVLLATSGRQEGAEYGVFMLSGPEDPETACLDAPIVNDTVAQSGRPCAWTMGQRYVSLADLTRPGVKVTRDLERA